MLKLQSEIPVALERLSGTLRRILAAIEWQKLYLAECRRWSSSTFWPRDHTREEIMDLVTTFYRLSGDIWLLLHGKPRDIPTATLKQWETRFREMQSVFGRLRTERYLKG